MMVVKFCHPLFLIFIISLWCQIFQLTTCKSLISEPSSSGDLRLRSPFYFPDNIPGDLKYPENPEVAFTNSRRWETIPTDSWRQPISFPQENGRKTVVVTSSQPQDQRIIFEQNAHQNFRTIPVPYRWVQNWLVKYNDENPESQGKIFYKNDSTKLTNSYNDNNILVNTNDYNRADSSDNELVDESQSYKNELLIRRGLDGWNPTESSGDSPIQFKYHSLIGMSSNDNSDDVICGTGQGKDVFGNCRRRFGRHLRQNT